MCLLLHTELVSEHGTDLPAVQELLLNGEQYNVIYTTKVFDTPQMALLI
jgi:hypothetical protein